MAVTVPPTEDRGSSAGATAATEDTSDTAIGLAGAKELHKLQETQELPELQDVEVQGDRPDVDREGRLVSIPAGQNHSRPWQPIWG